MADLRRVGATRLGEPAVRPPIWILVVAGSFSVYFGLLVYCDVFRPVNPGFEADPTHTGAVVVTRVGPATPASRAGIAVGDHLIAINGLTIIDSDGWGALGANYQIGVSMPVIVERSGARIDLRMLLEPESPGYWLERTGATLIVFRLAQLMTLLTGLFIAWKRPRDPRALAASWFLLTCAVFVIALPYRLATIWRDLPILRELLWIPYASGLTIGPILLTFVTIFPSRLPYARYVQAATWLVAAAAVTSPTYHAMQLVYVGTELRSVGPRSMLLLGVGTLSLVTALALLVVHHRRTTDLNERRRLRAVVVGITVGALPGFTAIVYFWLLGHTNQAQSIFASPGMVFAALGLLAAPLSIAHAVLRHRLFDLGFIIRIGLQYALARWSVLSIPSAVSMFMILETLRLRDETVRRVLERRGVLFLALTTMAIVVFWNRRRWLKAIDRRFFRERYNADEVLRDVAEQVRRASSLDRVAPVVVAKIEETIHPEFAALLVRDPSSRTFTTITAAPSADAPLDLSEDSKLAALARVVEGPLDTSEEGDDDSVLRHLPAADLEWVRRSRIDTLIPVITHDDRLHAMLVLGPKRSQEPYSREDYGVLVTIADNLALLVARAAPRPEVPRLEECPECGACFDGGTGICASHDRQLASRGLPRTLGGRYRLDRRLAEGGMGTVYEARDIALEQNVAAKVVREHLSTSDGALQRFMEEAKLAARLRGHPHVVMVHDFGSIDKIQPFMIMELLTGTTLRRVLEANGHLTPVRARAMLGDVCSAVSAAHRRGLIHRDLKPENIYLAETGQGTVPKVLDFGIAKPLSVTTTVDGRRETDARILIGTLEYMSPEQRRGESPSTAWDVWSLSVIALEMLSGRAPASTLMTNLGPWEPGQVLADTLPTCVDFFNRALSIDPAPRPRDAETFFRQLETVLQTPPDDRVRMWS